MYTVKINTASALQVEVGTAMHSTQVILRMLNGLGWKYKGIEGVMNRLEKLGGFRESGVSEKINVCGFPMPIKFPGTPTYKKTRDDWQKNIEVQIKAKGFARVMLTDYYKYVAPHQLEELGWKGCYVEIREV